MTVAVCAAATAAAAAAAGGHRGGSGRIKPVLIEFAVSPPPSPRPPAVAFRRSVARAPSENRTGSISNLNALTCTSE